MSSCALSASRSSIRDANDLEAPSGHLTQAPAAADAAPPDAGAVIGALHRDHARAVGGRRDPRQREIHRGRPGLGEAHVRQRDRDDEAQRFEQLLPEVVIEAGRDATERRQLVGDRLGHARVVVTEQHGAAARRQIKVLAILVVPHVRPVASDEAQVARAATENSLSQRSGSTAVTQKPPICALAYSRDERS